MELIDARVLAASECDWSCLPGLGRSNAMEEVEEEGTEVKFDPAAVVNRKSWRGPVLEKGGSEENVGLDWCECEYECE